MFNLSLKDLNQKLLYNYKLQVVPSQCSFALGEASLFNSVILESFPFQLIMTSGAGFALMPSP